VCARGALPIPNRLNPTSLREAAEKDLGSAGRSCGFAEAGRCDSEESGHALCLAASGGFKRRRRSVAGSTKQSTIGAESRLSLTQSTDI